QLEQLGRLDGAINITGTYRDILAQAEKGLISNDQAQKEANQTLLETGEKLTRISKILGISTDELFKFLENTGRTKDELNFVQQALDDYARAQQAAASNMKTTTDSMDEQTAALKALKEAVADFDFKKLNEGVKKLEQGIAEQSAKTGTPVKK